MGSRTERPWARKQFEESMERDFANHIIKREQGPPFSSWLCKKPDTNNYWFRVIAGHNLIVFTGDIGDLIVEPYCSDALAWMHGALRSPSYFAEKIVRNMEITQFDEKLVKRALEYEREQLMAYDEDDKPDNWDEMLESLEDLEERDFSNEHEFYEAFYNSELYVDEMPSVTGLSDMFYVGLCALRWFCLRNPEDMDVGETTASPSPRRRK